jgi:GNAT superfamily N-acetyltransferase
MLDIRPLRRGDDFASVRDLYRRSADYLTLEQGVEPDDETVAEFFNDAPPGMTPEDCVKLGIFIDGGLAGVADMAPGYPRTDDAFIGFLMMEPSRRDAGYGNALLNHLTGIARARGVRRMLIAVLDANRRGRAFWQREGFVLHETLPARQFRATSHVLHRMTRVLD